jgi:hypothetical protein
LDDWLPAATQSTAAAAETPEFSAEFDALACAAGGADGDEVTTGSLAATAVEDRPAVPRSAEAVEAGPAAVFRAAPAFVELECVASEGRWRPAARVGPDCAVDRPASVVELEPVDPAEPAVSAAAMAGMEAIAAPTPRAKASAPTRPT